MPDPCEAWWETHYGAVERGLANRAGEDDRLKPPADFCKTLKAQYAALVRCGADPDFVDHTLSRLAQDPRHRFIIVFRTGQDVWPNRRAELMGQHLSPEDWLQRHTRMAAMVPGMEALRQLSQEPSFATLSPPLQLHVLHDLHGLQGEFVRLIEPIYESWQRAEADPLVRLQEQDRPPVRRRGRPSSVLATAFMAVMNHHLRLRGSQGHARVVGEVAYALFPRAFTPHPRHPSGWSPADVGPDAPPDRH
jgi:hypothetical protein